MSTEKRQTKEELRRGLVKGFKNAAHIWIEEIICKGNTFCYKVWYQISKEQVELIWPKGANGYVWSQSAATRRANDKIRELMVDGGVTVAFTHQYTKEI